MDAIDQRLTALERRVQRLEAAPVSGSPEAATGWSRSGIAAQLLHQLYERVSEIEDDGQEAGLGDPTGAIVYAGAAGFAGREYLWAKEHRARDVAGADWAAAATMLGCLGSPARLVLLAALIDAPRSRAQLQEALGESSTGHLYHHLRELQSAGMLRQRRRGEYELAAHALVPLLIIVAAALDLETGEDVAPVEAEK